jgi:DedD protein
MERRVKERLIGAAILVALVVLLVPEFLSGPHHSNAVPAAPDPDTPMRTYWVDAAHVDSAPPAPQPPSAPVALPEAAPAAVPAAAPPPPVAAPPQIVARAPVAAPAQAAAKPAGSAGWTVQLGSFAGKANAESLMRQLKSEGFNAYIASAGTASAQRYRVRLGPIADRSTASAIMAKLQAQRHSSTLLPPSE